MRFRISYLVTRSDTIGGSSVHIRDLALAFREAGHSVHVLAGGNGMFSTELQRINIPYTALRYLVRPIRPGADLRALVELRSHLKALRPDLLSLHTAKAGWLGRLAAYPLGIPTVYTPHGWAFTEGVAPSAAHVYRLAERVIAPLTRHIINVCHYDRALALQHRVGSEQQNLVIHNGMLDVPLHLRANTSSQTTPHLVMIARFEAQKDHDTLLRALARLARRPWTLELIGGGPLRTHCERLARALGIRDRIQFAGERSDIAERLASAHLFVLVSNWEGFPRSILEAMRAGLPVVATDVAGVREAVVHGETGYLVRRKDQVALCSYLQPLLENHDLRASMGAKGRHRYESYFTFATMLERTTDLYHAVLQNHRPKPKPEPFI